MNPSTLIASPPNPARFRRVPVPERHFPDQRRASKTMDFRLSEEQQLFQDSVRGFAERNLAKGNLKRAQEADFPWDVAKLMAEQGLFGIAIPEKDGGQGGSLMDAVLAIEQVALVCPRSADVVQAGTRSEEHSAELQSLMRHS